jgi:hypothetical protein
MAKKKENKNILLIAIIAIFILITLFITQRLVEKQAFSTSSEAYEFEEPIFPGDWPIWRFWTPGCTGEAIVSNKYVDRGGTGGYLRPDYIQCSDGTRIDDPRLNDGVMRTKQGWDQVARVACCQRGPGCGLIAGEESSEPLKCDARECAKIHVNGKCSNDPKLREELRRKYPDWNEDSLPGYLCCYDYTDLEKKLP